MIGAGINGEQMESIGAWGNEGLRKKGSGIDGEDMGMEQWGSEKDGDAMRWKQAMMGTDREDRDRE